MLKPGIILDIRNVFAVKIDVVDLLVVLACLRNWFALGDVHLVFEDVVQVAVLGRLGDHVALLLLYLSVGVHLRSLHVHHDLRVVLQHALVHLQPVRGIPLSAIGLADLQLASRAANLCCSPTSIVLLQRRVPASARSIS